jgi:hypothetical protein
MEGILSPRFAVKALDISRIFMDGTYGDGQTGRNVMRLVSLPYLAASLVSLVVFHGNAQPMSDSVKTAVSKDSIAPARQAAAPKDSAVSPLQKSSPAPATAAAFDTLAGPLPEIIKPRGRPFLVIGDIEVPAGKSVTIGAGAVLLFKTFTGMHVLGRLSVEGTKDAPVVFTSENDRSVNRATALFPNPYDWNGIYIHADAVGSSFAYCKVLYSVYGLVSETKFIKLDPVILQFNGKSNLVIEGKEQQVTDKPYRYVLSTRDVAAEGVPVKILSDPLAPKRNALRYGGIVVAMAATVGAVYFGLQWHTDQANLSKMSTDDKLVLRSYDESEWTLTRTHRTNDIYLTAITGALAVVGYIGFGWSFTF